MKICLSIILMGALIYSCQKKTLETEINDQYLWLEEIESDQSLEWVKQRNIESEKVFHDFPLFDSLNTRFLETFDDPEKIAYPTIVGNYVYNLWQDEKNERGVWRRMPTTDYIAQNQDWETVLDLDKLSAQEGRKWVFGGARWLAPEHKFCLISLSDGGTDKSEIREFNAETRNFVEDGFYIEASKGGADWVDKNTLLISTDFGEGTLTTSGYPRIVKRWERSTPLANAEQVYEMDTLAAGIWPFTLYSDNKQYVFLYKWVSSFETELYYLNSDQFQKIDYPLDAQFQELHKNELIFALQSDWVVDGSTFQAGSVISFDLDESFKDTRKVNVVFQPDSKSSFASMAASKDFILLNYMQNVQNKLSRYQLIDGIWKGEAIKVPQFSSIFLLGSSASSNDLFYRYSNLITPTSLVYLNDQQQITLKKITSAFNTDGLIVQQHQATSKDGTLVPYFIVQNKEMLYDGKNPTLVYAYGGFNSSEQPYYSATRGIGWMEQGGVYVLANIRGGGEFGPSWHQAAIKENRQKAYDDFYAVTEDLIKRKITSPDYLGAFGWSNGGLLAGVALTQRPDLFEAVVVGAPLLDMKRYSHMLAGASWIGEYGNPDIDEEWDYLKKYSPYHNVFEDKEYPETLFITSIKDDRVHPGHARKMAAKMIDMGHPLFYHETIEGGHGAASTNRQQAEMWAMIYTYLNMKLNSGVTNVSQ